MRIYALEQFTNKWLPESWNRCQRRHMGSKRLDGLGDYLRHGYRLQIECRRCRRVVIEEPLPMLQLCHQRRWGHGMGEVRNRLKCSRCGSRDVTLGPAFGRVDT